MFCRAKTLILIFMQLCVSTGIAVQVTDISNQAPITSYPQPLFQILTGLSGWKPTQTATDACKLTFSSRKLNPAKCELPEKLSIFDSSKSKLWIDFAMSDKKQFQKIQIQLQPNLKIRGLLGLQQGIKPLVIIRLGIHGNIDEVFAERFLAKIAFENLGYNILVLENLTSHGHLSTNTDYSFGGIEEGLQTYFILQMIREKKFSWSPHISEIHLIGVSLGAHGAFVTQYLDEQSQKKPILSSVQLFCPVVNLEKNFSRLSNTGLFQVGVDVWNRIRIPKLAEKINYNVWPMVFDFKPQFLPSILKKMNKEKSKPILEFKTFQIEFPDLKLPEKFISHVNNSKTFFELNDFWSFYENKNTPITIYTTPDDPAVANDINTEMIRSKKQPGNFQNTQFIDLKGLHCGLASEYQWPFLVEMLKRGMITH